MNCLRFMEASGPRDSTTAAPVFSPALLDGRSPPSLALAVLVFLVGVDVRMGGVTVRSHSAVRVLVGAAALFLVRGASASHPTRRG